MMLIGGKNSSLGIITITDVRLTDDLRLARIYYSVLGDAEAKEQAAAALAKEKVRIRQLLGRKVRLKFLPVLEFRMDDTPARAGRVFELLKDIECERHEK